MTYKHRREHPQPGYTLPFSLSHEGTHTCTFVFFRIWRSVWLFRIRNSWCRATVTFPDRMVWTSLSRLTHSFSGSGSLDVTVSSCDGSCDGSCDVGLSEAAGSTGVASTSIDSSLHALINHMIAHMMYPHIHYYSPSHDMHTSILTSHMNVHMT